MTSSLRRIALLAVALLAAPAPAVAVADLFLSRVEVTDQSPDQRARAFRAALAEVVIRVTGDRAAPAAPELAALFNAPQRFVAEVAYVQDPPPPGPGEAPLAPGTPVRTLLSVRFEGAVLERALRDAGRAVLGRERPVTLFWLGIDDGPERDLVAADDADAFAAAALARGLPLAWPALDDEDRAAITLADLAGPDGAKVLAASVRHPHDIVLAGRASKGSRDWSGRFLLQLDAEGLDAVPIEVRAPSLELLAGNALDRVASELAARFGVRDDGVPTAIDVEVEGVADVVDYARAFAVLQKLSAVRKVDLAGSKDDVLRLRVTLRGDRATFERLVGLDRAFGRSTEAPSAGALRYRLAPRVPVAAAEAR